MADDQAFTVLLDVGNNIYIYISKYIYIYIRL